VLGKIAEKVPSLAEKLVNMLLAASVNVILSSPTFTASYVPKIVNSSPDAIAIGVVTAMVNAPCAFLLQPISGRAIPPQVMQQQRLVVMFLLKFSYSFKLIISKKKKKKKELIQADYS
jgi:hypothetical protein